MTNMEAEKLIDTENDYADKLYDMQDKTIDLEFDLPIARKLEAGVRRSFAQHIVADQIYSILSGFYHAMDRLEDAERMMAQRVAFNEVAYTGPHATLAAVLEAQADMLVELQHRNPSGMDKLGQAWNEEVTSKISSSILPLYTRALQICDILFGSESGQRQQVAKKIAESQAVLDNTR